MVPPAESSEPPADAAAKAALFTAVEQDLHAIAARLLRAERAGHTLQPTALLNEAWLRLDAVRNTWQDRSHFVRAAAGTMRRVLVDHARARLRDKRAPVSDRVTLAPELLEAGTGPEDLLAVDEILQQLAAVDEELVRIVELRVFGGLTHPEIAEAIGRPLRSVERGWRLARAFLRRELHDDPAR
jgi:RNA polymerase sigma factor (TIGR02999 family)